MCGGAIGSNNTALRCFSSNETTFDLTGAFEVRVSVCVGMNGSILLRTGRLMDDGPVLAAMKE